MRIKTLLMLVITTSMHAQAEPTKQAIDQLENTAAKIKRAKFFLSDDAIKKRIKSSMIKDHDKWQQARARYRFVLNRLRSRGHKIVAPDSLDELMQNRAHLDADKILMRLAKQMKHQSV